MIVLSAWCFMSEPVLLELTLVYVQISQSESESVTTAVSVSWTMFLTSPTMDILVRSRYLSCLAHP